MCPSAALRAWYWCVSRDGADDSQAARDSMSLGARFVNGITPRRPWFLSLSQSGKRVFLAPRRRGILLGGSGSRDAVQIT